ncbi:hypothetical protein [Methyloceanibacter sp.]|nr:hypothetical protein [Methyloceanibacter sp.]
MRTVIAFVVALGLSASFATVAFAGPDDCADGQTWDEATQTCVDN